MSLYLSFDLCLTFDQNKQSLIVLRNVIGSVDNSFYFIFNLSVYSHLLRRKARTFCPKILSSAELFMLYKFITLVKLHLIGMQAMSSKKTRL